MKKFKTERGISNSRKQLYIMVNYGWVKVSKVIAVNHFLNNIDIYSKI